MLLFVIVLIATARMFWPEITEATDWLRKARRRRQVRRSAHKECRNLDEEHDHLLRRHDRR